MKGTTGSGNPAFRGDVTPTMGDLVPPRAAKGHRPGMWEGTTWGKLACARRSELVPWPKTRIRRTR